MASCPHCGSTKLNELGPGEYLCQGSIEVKTGAPPSGSQGPPTRWTICGVKFFDPNFVGPGAASGSTCSCGTYSVGRCTSCGKEVCGQHSRLAHESRLCTRCAHARAEDEKASRDARRLEADVKISSLIDSFVTRMEVNPKWDISATDSDKTPRGWYVSMPNAFEYSYLSDSSSAQREVSFRPDLAVSDTGQMWSCRLERGKLRADGSVITSARQLAMLTHGLDTYGTDQEVDYEDVPRELEKRLNAAIQMPAAPSPVLSRREERKRNKRLRKESQQNLDERIYGPGGYKAYADRLYGDSFWARLKRWWR